MVSLSGKTARTAMVGRAFLGRRGEKSRVLIPIHSDFPAVSSSPMLAPAPCEPKSSVVAERTGKSAFGP